MEKKKEVVIFGEKVRVDPPHKDACDCILCQELEEYNNKYNN